MASFGETLMDKLRILWDGNAYADEYSDDDSSYTAEYDEEEEEVNNEIEDETPVEQPRSLYKPLNSIPLSEAKTTVVMCTPTDIKSSQAVLDHIRADHIVLCNLVGNCPANQRIVDYISGGVYLTGGRVEPTAIKTTFICTPSSVNVLFEDQNSEKHARVSAL